MYAVVLRPSATRALRETLPTAVAGAVVELLEGPLRQAPHAIGKPLDPPYDGWRVVRRGEYRVIYEIHDHERRVVVLRVAHRRDAYRGRPTGG